MKTETQLLSDIFRKSHLERSVAVWRCAGWGHEHGADCPSDYPTLALNLPGTEVDFARSLASFIGTSTLAYVPALEEWQIMDDGVYRALAGDYFVHNCIKRYANEYTGTYAGVETLLKSMTRKKTEESDKKLSEAVVNNNTDQQATIRGLIREIKDELKDDHNEFFADSKKLVRTLGTGHGINSITNILRSELCEMPSSNKASQFLGIDHLLNREVRKPLVDGMIPATGLGQLYGDQFTGKTYAATDLALSVCAGLGSWLGSPMNLDGAVNPEGESLDMTQDVVYVAAEGGQSFWNAVEGWKLGHPDTNLGKLRVLDSAEGVQLRLSDKALPPGEYGVEDLKRDLAADDIKPRLIIIDTQAKVTPGVDENSTALAHALQPLKEWADKEGILIILVHHTGKDSTKGARGSSAQAAMMDLLIEFRMTQDSRQMHFLKIKGGRQPDKPMNVGIQSITSPSGDELAYLIHAGAVIPKAVQKETQILATRDLITTALKNGENSVKAIADKYFGGNRGKVDPEIKRMADEGLIENLGKPNRPNWVLVLSPALTPQ